MWAIYGAGRTSQSIIEAIIQRGLRPKLLGRNAAQVQALAERYQLDWQIVALDQPNQLAQALNGMRLVLNTAGPFKQTAKPLVEVCLTVGCDYLDVTNEVEVFQQLYGYDQAAQKAGIRLIPGVGFGVVASDGFTQRVAAQLPNPIELKIVIQATSAGSSAATTRTYLDLAQGQGWVKRAGQLQAIRFGSLIESAQLPDGQHTIVPIPTGNLLAASLTTQIPNITVYNTLGLPLRLAQLAIPLLQQGLRFDRLRQFIEQRGAAASRQPIANPQSYVWVQARNSQGKISEAYQTMGEGFEFTAAAASLCIEKTLSQTLASGFYTPSMAFGNDLALEIAGTQRIGIAQEYAYATA